MSETTFEDIWHGAQGMFDSIFGAKFSFQPMREVKNALPIPDPSRAAIAEVVGIPVIDGHEQILGGQTVQRSTTMPYFSFQQAKFPQGIQQFDRLRRVSGPTRYMNRLFEVSEVVPDPEAIYRLRVRLKEIPALDS